MGKKISNFLKGEIVSSVFYLAFGLCLILIPDQTVNIICKIVFGLVMIAVGIYHIAIYAAEKEKATILDLFTGVIVTVLGIFLFFTPQIVIRILPYLLGAFVLVDSIWKIKGSYRLKKAERGCWKILLIGCLIFIALGISMLFYSFMSVTKMILFSGIILTADGEVDIVFLVMLRLGMRKTEKLRNEKPKEDKKQEKPEPVETGSTYSADYAGKTDNAEKPAETGSEESNTESYPEYTGNSENSSESDINTVYQTEDSTENSIYDSYQAEDSAQTEGSDQTENNAKCQEPETNLELETEETADEADAKLILDKKVYSADADMESPNREIREMLKNHDEPLEEWKD